MSHDQLATVGDVERGQFLAREDVGGGRAGYGMGGGGCLRAGVVSFALHPGREYVELIQKPADTLGGVGGGL